MYESPIKIIYGQMQTQLEGDILKAVMSTDIQVDKEELTRALQYDRNQYERGFADGYMKAQRELVRCKDCKHCIFNDDYNERECVRSAEFNDETGQWYGFSEFVEEDHFCSYGERKDNA